MEPTGDLCQNVSQLPKFFILLEVLAKMKNRYHSPNRPSFPLPPGMTYSDIGLQARERISFRNPLDPLEGVQWNADLYARPRRNDPHWINVDLMNPLQTGMPYIPHDYLTEITLGPYQIQLSMGYTFQASKRGRPEETISTKTGLITMSSVRNFQTITRHIFCTKFRSHQTGTTISLDFSNLVD